MMNQPRSSFQTGSGGNVQASGYGQPPPQPPTFGARPADGNMAQPPQQPQYPQGQMWANQQGTMGSGQYPPGGYPPQQPSQCPCCGPPTPNDPNASACEACAPMFQYCDGAVWVLVLCFLLSLAGFIAVLASEKEDDIWAALSVSGSHDSRQLATTMTWMVAPEVNRYQQSMLQLEMDLNATVTPAPTIPPLCNVTISCSCPTTPPTITVTPTPTPTNKTNQTNAPNATANVTSAPTSTPIPTPSNITNVTAAPNSTNTSAPSPTSVVTPAPTCANGTNSSTCANGTNVPNTTSAPTTSPSPAPSPNATHLPNATTAPNATQNVTSSPNATSNGTATPTPTPTTSNATITPAPTPTPSTNVSNVTNTSTPTPTPTATNSTNTTSAPTNQTTPTPSTNTTATPTPTPTNNSTNGTNSSSTKRRLLQSANGAPSPIDFPPVARKNCSDGATKDFVGARGTICRTETLTAEMFLINIVHWVNFRGTLYFLALVSTFTVLVLTHLIHRFKNQEIIMQNPVNAPPTQLYRTPLYGFIMTAWTVSSIPIFLFVAHEMYQYWMVIEFYKSNTTGALQAYWMDFDRKHIPCIVCVWLFLCWPFLWFWAKIGLFIAFIMPWYMLRGSFVPPQYLNQRPAEATIPDQPWAVQLDAWFMETFQFYRYGLGSTTWFLVTGKKEGEQPLQQFPQGGQVQPGGQGGQVQPAWQGQEMNRMATTAETRGISPNQNQHNGAGHHSGGYNDQPNTVGTTQRGAW